MGAAGSWTGRHRHVLLVLRKPSLQYLSIEGAGSPHKNKNWDKGGFVSLMPPRATDRTFILLSAKEKRD